MNKTEYFKRKVRNDLFAASLAVSYKDWISIDAKEYRNNEKEVASLMNKNRFDIIPVKDSRGQFSLYITTLSEGKYDRIKQEKIDTEDDCIYYLTHIRDVVQMLVENKRNFYFLTDYSSVIGLLTLSDLNDKFFYHWLYQELFDLERILGEKLCSEISDNLIFEKIQEIASVKDEKGEWFKETLTRFKNDIDKNLDTSILEYLTFKQIIEIFSQFELYKKIGYKTVSDFQKGNKALGEIRNTIAHPTRSLINNSSSLFELWKGILKIEELTNRIVQN